MQRGACLLLLLACWSACVTADSRPHFMGGIAAQVERAIEAQERKDRRQVHGGERLGASQPSEAGLETATGLDSGEDVPDMPCEVDEDEEYPCVRRHLRPVVKTILNPEDRGAVRRMKLKVNITTSEVAAKWRLSQQPRPKVHWKTERRQKVAASKAQAKVEDRQMWRIRHNIVREVESYHDASARVITLNAELRAQSIKTASEVQPELHLMEKRRVRRFQIALHETKVARAKARHSVAELNATYTLFTHKVFAERHVKAGKLQSIDQDHPPTWLMEAKKGVAERKESEEERGPPSAFMMNLDAELKNQTAGARNRTLEEIKQREYLALQHTIGRLRLEVMRQKQLVHGMRMFDPKSLQLINQKSKLRVLESELAKELDDEKKTGVQYRNIEKRQEGRLKSELDDIGHTLTEEVGVHLRGGEDSGMSWFRRLWHEARQSSEKGIKHTASVNMGMREVSDAKVEEITNIGLKDRDQLEATHLGDSLKAVTKEMKDSADARIQQQEKQIGATVKAKGKIVSWGGVVVQASTHSKPPTALNVTLNVTASSIDSEELITKSQYIQQRTTDRNKELLKTAAMDQIRIQELLAMLANKSNTSSATSTLQAMLGHNTTTTTSNTSTNVSSSTVKEHAQIEAESKKIQALPDGPVKDAALASLAEKSKALAALDALAAKMKAKAAHGKLATRDDSANRTIKTNRTSGTNRTKLKRPSEDKQLEKISKMSGEDLDTELKALVVKMKFLNQQRSEYKRESNEALHKLNQARAVAEKVSAASTQATKIGKHNDELKQKTATLKRKVTIEYHDLAVAAARQKVAVAAMREAAAKRKAATSMDPEIQIEIEDRETSAVRTNAVAVQEYEAKSATFKSDKQALTIGTKREADTKAAIAALTAAKVDLHLAGPRSIYEIRHKKTEQWQHRFTRAKSKYMALKPQPPPLSLATKEKESNRDLKDLSRLFTVNKNGGARKVANIRQSRQAFRQRVKRVTKRSQKIIVDLEQEAERRGMELPPMPMEPKKPVAATVAMSSPLRTPATQGSW